MINDSVYKYWKDGDRVVAWMSLMSQIGSEVCGLSDEDIKAVNWTFRVNKLQQCLDRQKELERKSKNEQ